MFSSPKRDLSECTFAIMCGICFDARDDMTVTCFVMETLQAVHCQMEWRLGAGIIVLSTHHPENLTSLLLQVLKSCDKF